ncbi:MAG: beta-ketoacyl-ACP synthase III [Pseudomonadales bacterium]|nr:beta-ketoacyl-ACP synthase III [Pseudomonadales bacterium]MCP5183294.1 beta-ketoacyl-ACP synthase III [Pseudomonadales bacterium]
MNEVVISGVGLWHPADVITNEELVGAYNAWAARENHRNADAIAAGETTEIPLSSAEFIEKASGIRQRYAYVKDGILDIDRMRPRLPERGEDALSHQAEIALNAAVPALAAAGKSAADIDLVIVSCAYTQRAYPAIAIEVQAKLGIDGAGFDMLVACSAATFALQRAHDAIAAGSARAVLVINPELTSPQVNYRDRDGHFIFGDVATAMVLERAETCTALHSYTVLGTRARTVYSNNIRSNFGYLSYADDSNPYAADKLFHQNGRRVFKEVCPMAADHLLAQIQSVGLAVADIRRWWLHQANINMNQLIVRRLLGTEPSQDVSPIVLDEYANTASAGSLIAFALHHEDLKAGDHGVICSFGAGYSIGSLVLRKR